MTFLISSGDNSPLVGTPTFSVESNRYGLCGAPDDVGNDANWYGASRSVCLYISDAEIGALVLHIAVLISQKDILDKIMGKKNITTHIQDLKINGEDIEYRKGGGENNAK